MRDTFVRIMMAILIVAAANHEDQDGCKKQKGWDKFRGLHGIPP